MTPDVVDARSTPRTRAVLRRLFALYVHDLSPHTSFYSLDDRGRWVPELWRDWLANAHVDPWLFEAHGQVLGFAVVGHRPFPHMSPDRQHKLCEFFILAPHRRSGIGRAAATSIFDRYPGSWELTVLPGNLPAVSFWRRTLGAYTRGRCEEVQLPVDILLRFQSPGAS